MNNRKKNVTILDIAKELGVSSAMVSTVLSGKGPEQRISAKSIIKVLATAKRLGYKPNQMARALRTGKSFIIGLLVADISNSFFSQIARLIENEAEKYDYQVVFASCDESVNKFKKLGDVFISRQVDGIILVPVSDSQDIIAAWKSRGIPMVAIDRYFSTLGIPYAVTNNYEASVQMVEYISKKGYKKIAYIGMKSNLSSFNEREEGFRASVKNLKMKPEQAAVFRLDSFSWELEMKEVIEKIVEEKFDIIFFGQNMIGIQGVRIINNFKIIIPDDIAIISFDNPNIFEFCKPPITCIEQPLEKLAKEALSCLFNLIEDEFEETYRCKKYPARLIIRDSC